MSNLGSDGVRLPIFAVIFKGRVAQKLSGNSKIHGQFVILYFHFPQIQKLLIFMIFGPSGNAHGPQHQLFSTVDLRHDLK